MLNSGGPGIVLPADDILPDLKRNRINAGSLISLAGLGELKKMKGRRAPDRPARQPRYARPLRPGA